jgi:hypothetical protein
MKRTLTVVLVAALATAGLQVDAKTSDGGTGSWARVKTLPSGSPLEITVAGTQWPIAGHFIAATDEDMTLLDVSRVSAPRQAARFLQEVARKAPGYLTAQPGEYVTEDFRLTGAALFYRGTQIAVITDFVNVIYKDQIIAVIKPARGPSAGAVAGAASIGVVAGLLLLPYFLFTPCHGSCAGIETQMVLTLAGLPIAGGYLAAMATRRKAETIYHA